LNRPDTTQRERLRAILDELNAAGSSLIFQFPDGSELGCGDAQATRVCFRDGEALDAILRGDHLALADAFLQERVDVQGSLRDVIRVTDQLDVEPDRFGAVAFWLRFLFDRRRFNRDSISFHYDRPPDFFLSWLGPARCYTHGFYTGPDDDLARAEIRKLQYAVDALSLEAGSRVLDVGCGWGSFLEYAGLRGIEVHGITISREQFEYVQDRIHKQNLPCSVELVDFHDFRPTHDFDAAVFMGSLEHLPGLRRVSRFLARHLRPNGRVYADFVTSREGRMSGAFLRRHIFPGVSHYVDLPGLRSALERAGFSVGTVEDDTASCAYTVRDWALRLEAHRTELAVHHGEAAVRAFLLYLWASHHFLIENQRTQAYHLVASRGGA
jgi:cyclopropane-fatty-acyl-phospholipid synthase